MDWYKEVTKDAKDQTGIDWYSEMRSATSGQTLDQNRKAAETKNVSTEDKSLPEFDMPFEFSARQFKTALGLMTTFDNKRELEIVKRNYPEMKFMADDEGNIIVDATKYGGNVGYLNAPGISARDLTDVGFQVAAFTPAGKVGTAVANAGKGLLARMGATGAATSATQVGLDLTGQATASGDRTVEGLIRGEEPSGVSLSNVDWVDAGVAGAAGAVFEGLSGPIGRVAGKIFNSVFKSKPVITDQIRDEFKAAAKQAGRDPAEVTDDLIMSWMRAANEATRKSRVGTPQALQQSDEFGIPYTKGQATGNARQLELEDTLRNVGGTRASETMAKFGDEQATAIREGARGIQRTLGGGASDLIGSPNQAAASVKEGVQSRAAILDDAVSKAYESIPDARLSVQGIKGLMTRMSRIAKNPEFESHPELVPGFKSLVNEVDDFSKFLSQSGSKSRPLPLRRLESMRKRINAKIGAAPNATDKRQLTIMKREFDNYIDKAVDRALFYGDDAAIDALKDARWLRREYALKFQRADVKTRSGFTVKDDAGDVIERIISADPTNEQVANYLFGSAKLGGNKVSAKLASRLKSVLGPESTEWGNIRQAAFIKLIEPSKNSEVISGRVFASRLKEAMEGSGETFMRELFTPQELGTMRRFAEAIKRAQPEIGNPSRTAYKTASMLNQAAGQVWRIFGWSHGPAGGVAAEAAMQGKGILQNMSNAAKANNAITLRPFSRAGLVPTAGAPGSVGLIHQDQARP